MDPELDGRLTKLQADMDRVTMLLDEFVPLLRAYLDPDQDGPRGWFMRRQIARSNGHG